MPTNIQIVTDSTAYIDKAFTKENNIVIAPLTVNFEGVVSDEGYPGEFKEFFDRLANSSDFPSTSQPSIGVYKNIYEEALKEGKEVIVLTISSELSGTFNSASTAATLVDADKITVIDSLTVAANLRVLTEMAVQFANQGLTRKEIVEKLEVEKERMGIFLTVGTLEYLKKGGRLSNAEALIGSILNIKPIIHTNNGKLEPFAKVRGRKKSLEKIVESVPVDVTNLNICHIFALDEAEELKNLLEERFPSCSVNIEELGPVIGAHLGPKALGVAFKY